MNKIHLPDDVIKILKTLNKYGEGVIVGGAIRDSILGLEPKDYDFATNIPYDKLSEIFAEYNPKEIGKAFGVIQITVNEVHYEIAKYRTETSHSNCRNPDSVEFVDTYVNDASRRDFTINSIAFGKDGLIDPFNGMEDLKNGILRFIGNADNRIEEDALRALRAIRFANKYNLKLDDAAFNAIIDNRELINKLSKERIRDEFNKILLTDVPSNGIRLLESLNILEIILPELKECIDFDNTEDKHSKPVYEHLLLTMDYTRKDIATRLSALLHDIGKPKCFEIIGDRCKFHSHDKKSAEIAENIVRRLKYDNDTIADVITLILNHMNKGHKKTPKAIRNFIRKVGEERLFSMFDLMRADILGSNNPPFNFNSLDTLVEECHKVVYSNEPIRTNQLAINGKDVIELGIKEGKEVGIILNECLELVLSNPEKNDRNILLDFIRGVIE